MADTLVQFFNKSVETAPDAEAVVHGKRRITYGQLWEKCCRVALFLREKGLGSGDRVALLMENSPEYIAAYYGILAAGGVAVGLNIAGRARDLLNWINHSNASWLIAAGRNQELPKVIERVGDKTRLMTVGRTPSSFQRPEGCAEWEDLESAEGAHSLRDDRINDREQPAAIIYTSGTTGNPKGVCLSHKNLAANTSSILDYLQLTGRDRIVNVLPFTYSYGNSILHTHLAVGGTIILENSFVYPHKVVETMSAERATGFSGVPSSFALLLARTNLNEYDLSALRYITQAGGPMPPANQKRLKSILPGVDIFIMYGQTEASARLTYLPPQRLDEKLGSCGIPIPGVQIEIRDKKGKKLPPHKTGEICAHGDNIMLGYWSAPEMTREVLQDGWLRTGDLAHFDDDGFIFIDGRLSEMIKSGGQRISPLEIEDVICELDGIAEVGVVGVEDEMLGQVIKAVIVCKPGITVEEKRIKRHCLQNLAAYKIPKIVEFAEALPKTGSGKLKRHLL